MKLIKKHPTENKYSAFVCFKDENAAQLAFNDLTQNPPILPGADDRVYANWYQGRAERQRELRRHFSQAQNETNLYLKNLKEDATEQELKKAFQQFGNITSVAVREWKAPNSDKKAKYGFVAFDNRDDAKRAQAEALKNQDIRDLYLSTAMPYINLHQSRDKRNEYLLSLRRKKMQTNYMDMFNPPRMPYIPNRRFQPYPPVFNQQQMKPMMPRMGGGPRNVGGGKQWAHHNPKGQRFGAGAPIKQQYPSKMTQGPKKEEKPLVQEKPTQKTGITVDNLRNKMSEFLALEDEKQRQILGELLFPLIKKQAGDQLAPKITGMLIDLSVLEVTEILEFLEDPTILHERVAEAMELIQGENA